MEVYFKLFEPKDANIYDRPFVFTDTLVEDEDHYCYSHVFGWIKLKWIMTCDERGIMDLVDDDGDKYSPEDFEQIWVPQTPRWNVKFDTDKIDKSQNLPEPDFNQKSLNVDLVVIADLENRMN